MPIISSVSQNNTSQTNTSTGVSSTTENQSKNENDSAEVAKDSRRIELSDRAQKIQKLNEEFFKGGPSSVKITPDFIARLQEYGFLDKNQANQLSASAQQTAIEDKSSLGQLSNFIDSFSEKLEKQNPTDSLISTLNKAKSIINNFDGSKPSSLASDIKTVSAELTQYINDNEIDKDDKEQLEELNLALKIADNLKPDNLSTAKVNNYLKILSGSL